MENNESMENNKTNHKDITKEKIILFVIGVLVGAVISTGSFFAYIKLAGVGTSNTEQSMQMPGGTPPEKPDSDTNQSNSTSNTSDSQTNSSNNSNSNQSNSSDSNTSSDNSQNTNN